MLLEKPTNVYFLQLEMPVNTAGTEAALLTFSSIRILFFGNFKLTIMNLLK